LKATNRRSLRRRRGKTSRNSDRTYPVLRRRQRKPCLRDSSSFHRIPCHRPGRRQSRNPCLRVRRYGCGRLRGGAPAGRDIDRLGRHVRRSLGAEIVELVWRMCQQCLPVGRRADNVFCCNTRRYSTANAPSAAKDSTVSERFHYSRQGVRAAVPCLQVTTGSSPSRVGASSSDADRGERAAPSPPATSERPIAASTHMDSRE
jgi:hypothetical protein